MRGSAAVVKMLDEVGVEVVFGLCGDTTLPLYESLATMDHGIRHVLARDERSASFMADAYARLSGKVGMCEGPSGGGATYILPGVAEANESSVPMVCLTSDIDVNDAGRGTLTEMDQVALFASVAKSSVLPRTGADLPDALRNAFRDATTGALGAAHVALPYNVQLEEVLDADTDIDPAYRHTPSRRLQPESGAVKSAARLLSESRRPLLVAGAGVLRSGAWGEMTALAHLLGAPLATSISGKGSIAETDPYSLGVIGSNGGLPYRHEMLRESDLICYVGCRLGSVTTEKWTLPATGDKTIVHLDVDSAQIGKNYETAVGVVGDAQCGLAAIIEAVSDLLGGNDAGRVDPSEIADRHDAHMSSIQSLLSSAQTPIRPERFVAELDGVLAPGSVICADPGTPCPYLSAYYRLPQAGRWFACPRAHGALGYALPAVVGAYHAKPDAARIVGVMGDGSFGISAGELETIVRLDLPVTLIVLNNASYGWIKAGQKQLGENYFSVDFSDSNHAAVADAYGMRGVRVEDPAALHDVLASAMTGGPVLVDVVVQPLQEANAPVSKWVA